MTQAQILQRLDAIELQISELNLKISGNGNTTEAGNVSLTPPAPRKTWEDYIGMFAGDKHFAAAVKAGAAYRKSLRPRARKRKARRS